jgi:hypothetical protein
VRSLGEPYPGTSRTTRSMHTRKASGHALRLNRLLRLFQEPQRSVHMGADAGLWQEAVRRAEAEDAVGRSSFTWLQVLAPPTYAKRSNGTLGAPVFRAPAVGGCIVIYLAATATAAAATDLQLRPLQLICHSGRCMQLRPLPLISISSLEMNQSPRPCVAGTGTPYASAEATIRCPVWGADSPSASAKPDYCNCDRCN